MRHPHAIGPFAFALSCVVLAVACVGDEPSTDSPRDATGQPDGSAGDTNDSADAGQLTCKGDTTDACGTSCTKCKAPVGGAVDCVSGKCQPTCGGTETLCGDTCVATATSVSHCGKCDHACGGGACTGGVCQPLMVATGFTDVHAIATSPSGLVISADSDLSLCADPTGCTAATSLTTIKGGVSQLADVTVAGANVYFHGNEGDYEVVYRCPLAGCPVGGPDIIENIVNDDVGRIVAGPTDVLWTRYQSYYGPYSRRCSLPGCSANVEVRVAATTGPYSSNASREMTVPSKVVSVGAVSTLWATGALYSDNLKQLRACPLTSACATPTEINTDGASVSALTYYDGKHYGASSASGGGDVIFSVGDATVGARTLLVADASGITDVAVDASGIYWVNGTTGKVLRCAALTGCSGSGETLAVGHAGALGVRLDAKFVYWMTKTTVMKVAK